MAILTEIVPFPIGTDTFPIGIEAFPVDIVPIPIGIASIQAANGALQEAENSSKPLYYSEQASLSTIAAASSGIISS